MMKVSTSDKNKLKSLNYLLSAIELILVQIDAKIIEEFTFKYITPNYGGSSEEEEILEETIERWKEIINKFVENTLNKKENEEK